FDPDGRTLARVRPDGVLELADLTAGERPFGEQRALAEVLSGRRISASSGLMPLEDERFRAAWDAAKGGAGPGPRGVLGSPAWHRGQAEAAAEMAPGPNPGGGRKDVRSAEWHLDRVLAARPRDADALRLRAVLRGEAGRWDEALRDWDALVAAGDDGW